MFAQENFTCLLRAFFQSPDYMLRIVCVVKMVFSLCCLATTRPVPAASCQYCWCVFFGVVVCALLQPFLVLYLGIFSQVCLYKYVSVDLERGWQVLLLLLLLLLLLYFVYQKCDSDLEHFKHHRVCASSDQLRCVECNIYLKIVMQGKLL